MKRRWVGALAAVIPLSPLGAQGVAYEGGVSFLTGYYFDTTRTTSWSVGTGIAYTLGGVTLRAAVPIFAQNSSLEFASGGGMMPSGGGRGNGGGGMTGGTTTTTTAYRAAPGDPTVQAAWRVMDGARTALTIAAAVKIPITDTTDFGSGEWDVGSTFSLTQYAGAAVFIGLDFSYWHLGDLPTLDFRDPVTATLTAAHLFQSNWGTSVFVMGGTSALRDYDPPVLVGATVTRLGRGTLWGLNAAIGLTNTMPDVAISATWRVTL